MKNWWNILAGRIDALSLRERVFLFVIVLSCLLVLADAVWLSPARKQQNQAEASVKKQSTELQELRAQFRTGMLQTAATDGGQAAPPELSLLKSRLETVNRDIAALSASPGVELSKVLVHFLRRHEGLTLERTVTLADAAPASDALSMETPMNEAGSLSRQGMNPKDPGYYKEAEALIAKVVPLAAPKGAAGSLPQQGRDLKVPGSSQAAEALAAKSASMANPRDASRPFSRQGMELTVSGSYLELMRYVQTLEQSLPALRWGRMKISSGKSSPQLTLQVFLVEGSP